MNMKNLVRVTTIIIKKERFKKKTTHTPHVKKHSTAIYVTSLAKQFFSRTERILAVPGCVKVAKSSTSSTVLLKVNRRCVVASRMTIGPM